MKFVLSLLLAVLPTASHADESVEPKLNYTLKIGDRSYPVAEGEAFKVDAISEKSDARLVADAHRTFSYQDLTFKYPRYYTFEAALSDTKSKSWVLSGNDAKIMILTIKGALTHRQYAEVLAKKLGEKNTTIEDAEANLGTTVYRGSLVDARIASAHLTLEVLPVTAPEGWTRLLVIQDTVGKDGAHSKEYKEQMETLRGSFAEKKAGK